MSEAKSLSLILAIMQATAVASCSWREGERERECEWRDWGGREEGSKGGREGE